MYVFAVDCELRLWLSTAARLAGVTWNPWLNRLFVGEPCLLDSWFCWKRWFVGDCLLKEKEALEPVVSFWSLAIPTRAGWTSTSLKARS